MTPFAAIAVRTAGAAGAAALLSLGLAGGMAQAATPAPKPTPAAGSTQQAPAARADRRAIFRAVFESEADVLGISPKTLRHDLRAGQKVSDLARDKGMTEEQFETRLIAIARPRLEALVDQKVITQAQADKAVDRISKGHIPFWNGVHRK
jgi:membrane-bound lytic murein transglycosylase B